MNPVSRLEVKVPVAASGSVLGVALTQLVLWLVETQWLDGPVPAQVEAALWTIIPFAATWAGGYWAPHTSRPDLPPSGEVVPLRPHLPPSEKVSSLVEMREDG